MALLVVLDTMTPAERVSFVLHDVFQFSFREIAEIVGRTDHACRQLASSARQKAARSRTPGTSRHERAEIVRAFKDAWATGDLERLLHLLDPNAVAITDGGGKVTAATEPLVGADTIAEFLLAVLERQPDLQIIEADVNGEPGLITRAGDTPLSVISLAAEAGHIQHIWAMRNPDKLTEWR
jgi:RNA polymerase sigma-70 factor (ECF subfamily)